MNAKFTGFFLLVIILISGCRKTELTDYTYTNERTIYSESDRTVFREVLFIIKPYLFENGVKYYIATDTITDIKMLVNQTEWGSFKSFGIDITKYNPIQIGYFDVLQESLPHPVVAHYQTTTPVLQYAGEYADMLNNLLTIEPGHYIVQIESFSIRNGQGNIVTIYPKITVPMEVKENNRSTFLGDFEVNINN